jgi:L-asparaginase/Glu-tRNA(Gln) amidotransferase subunit D
MKNILLILTGGTIGSQLENGSIDTRLTAAYKLVQLFRQQYPEHGNIAFKTLQPNQILSENLHPKFWQSLIQTLEQEDLSAFDGIIVTHGTDTLAFTAAVLGIYFHRLPIPLLMVSSNYPLDNPHANGLDNFICAVDYIRQQEAHGVFVAYKNPGDEQRLHIGTRLLSCLPLSGDFISVQAKAFMTYSKRVFTALHPLPERHIRQSLRNRFARILLIKPYPGLDYRQFQLDGIDAVLHELYHSGTACATSQWGAQHSLVEFSLHCQQRKLPLYLAPAIHSDAAYSSTCELLAHGAKMIWNTSLETAYAKLSLAYANFSDSAAIDAFLAENVAWEQV